MSSSVDSKISMGAGAAADTHTSMAAELSSASGRVCVSLLDYGAGNVRSIRNAIVRAGFDIVDVKSADDIRAARILVFPGVGAFGCAMDFLDKTGYREPLLEYLASGRPYMGICLGLQTLFEGSEESPGRRGLGFIPGQVSRFPRSSAYSVPHIGWNGLSVHQAHPAIVPVPPEAKIYFVHSFRAQPTAANKEWVVATTDYGDGQFISAVGKGNIFATQFHPEKSGNLGIAIFRAFLRHAAAVARGESPALAVPASPVVGVDAPGRPHTRLARRVVACLDVRTNDDGDLVVTKGDKYDVRENDSDAGDAAARPVRNLGKPVELAARYYEEGADEVAFLNITAFREEPLDDVPMLAVLEAASERVFVPLTIGGGIRAYTDSKGSSYTALDVAARYFRAGADKISIGSDAVFAAEAYYARGKRCDGSTAIEAIAEVYGRQAVVVSVDPRRVYVASPDDAEVVAAGHHVIETKRPGPAGERWCWYQCTVRGGREGRPLCAYRLAQAVEALGAGELLVNCVDQDGQKNGYDEELLSDICGAVSIPVIASSGAGVPAHFSSVCKHTRVEAVLAAGIFHRREVAISDVKAHLRDEGIEAVIQPPVAE